MGLTAMMGLVIGRLTAVFGLRQVVGVGWKIMLVVTIVTVVMIVTRIIPRRTR